MYAAYHTGKARGRLEAPPELAITRVATVMHVKVLPFHDIITAGPDDIFLNVL